MYFANSVAVITSMINVDLPKKRPKFQANQNMGYLALLKDKRTIFNMTVSKFPKSAKKIMGSDKKIFKMVHCSLSDILKDKEQHDSLQLRKLRTIFASKS